MWDGARMNCYLLTKTEQCKRVLDMGDMIIDRKNFKIHELPEIKYVQVSFPFPWLEMCDWTSAFHKKGGLWLARGHSVNGTFQQTEE